MSDRQPVDPAERGTVGDGNYEVGPGDCLDSIAFENGFFWETLWNLGANARLKQRRKNPNILFPGDRLTIPAVRIKRVPGATGKRHRFQLRGVPAKLRLRFLEDDVPLDGVKWELRIDGKKLFSGTLDKEGRLVQSIAPNAKRVEIRLGDEEEWTKIPLGTVDPITEISGVQGRLNDLGFAPGPIDNISGPKTCAAIARFQRKYKLVVTGEPDEQTQEKLKEIYGC